MNARHRFIAFSLLVSAPFLTPSSAQAASFSTLIKTSLVIEGLTGDNKGNLYAPGRQPGAGVSCPVYRVNIANPGTTPTTVGFIPAPSATAQCSPSGLAFDRAGNLYVADGDKIYKFLPNETTQPTATVFATGLPGTNGVAFDKSGNLWTGDGTTGQGRVWKIGPAGGAGVEMFRVQPMANDVNIDVDGIGGIGRDARTLPPGTIDFDALTPRTAANTAGSQPLVANGVAFDKEGNILVADTARGAIWKASFTNSGALKSKTGCDTTFPSNTLCLENILVAHPLLEGADGLALDNAGNIFVDANERNAVVVVANDGRVIEVFRNPPDGTTNLRNVTPLEFPASPFISGIKLCTSNSDNNRRDNSPNTAGEIKPAGPDRGKISCMDQPLAVRGLPLPIR